MKNMKDRKFQSQEKETLKEWVIKEIKAAIIDGRLKSQERVNESKIAEEMGLSKSPIREAVNELVKDGILVSEPFKGAVVKGLTKKEAHELYSLRAVLEAFAVDLMEKPLNPDALETMDQIVLDMKDAAHRNNLDKMIELDLKFHQYLMKLSGHQLLLEIWERIYGRISMYMGQKSRFFENLEEDAALHEALVEKIRTGEMKNIKKLLEKHIYHYSALATASLDH